MGEIGGYIKRRGEMAEAQNGLRMLTVLRRTEMAGNQSLAEGAGFELSVSRRETRLIRIRPSTQKSVERQLADTDDALARQPVRDELSAGVFGPPSIVETDGARGWRGSPRQ